MSIGQYALLFGGTFVGVFLGHAIIRSIFGTSHRSPAPAFEQPSYAVDPCARDSEYLAKCIEASSSDIRACQFYMDALKRCQEQSRY
mmetsp:Transcript_32815/g.57239  ORF Transcript_32815/g.57239 Transcript_32815/m.57239 type:complete len:87 (+) Transcript_32815:4649-4909(+)